MSAVLKPAKSLGNADPADFQRAELRVPTSISPRKPTFAKDPRNRDRLDESAIMDRWLGSDSRDPDREGPLDHGPRMRRLQGNSRKQSSMLEVPNIRTIQAPLGTPLYGRIMPNASRSRSTRSRLSFETRYVTSALAKYSRTGFQSTCGGSSTGRSMRRDTFEVQAVNTRAILLNLPSTPGTPITN